MVGARPQFVKLAPVVAAMSAAGVDHTIVHTGQHYDAHMSDAFFDGLGLPTPDHNLAIGSASHGAQTGRMLTAVESVLMDAPPDWVLVYGDTNSTLAAAIAAVKLGIPTAHLEAGLRSYNRAMPEEVNRVLTDHAADLLLTPTDHATSNLHREGLGDRTVQVGDVMADLCLQAVSEPDRGATATSGPFVVATIHRASNTDDPVQLTRIVKALSGVPARVLLLGHPRLVAAAARSGLTLGVGAIELMEPQPYLQTMRLIRAASGVVTDSGGLQKEAFLLGTPCLTIRTETEWPETLEDEWNILDPLADRVRTQAIRIRPSEPKARPFGDGTAAVRVVEALQGSRAMASS